MNVLVSNIGGTNVKILGTGQQEPVKFPSEPAMTATAMVAGSQEAHAGLDLRHALAIITDRAVGGAGATFIPVRDNKFTQATLVRKLYLAPLLLKLCIICERLEIPQLIEIFKPALANFPCN